MLSNKLQKHLNLACVIANSVSIGIAIITGNTNLIAMNGLFIGLCSYQTLRFAKLEALEDEGL